MSKPKSHRELFKAGKYSCVWSVYREIKQGDLLMEFSSFHGAPFRSIWTFKGKSDVDRGE